MFPPASPLTERVRARNEQMQMMESTQRRSYSPMVAAASQAAPQPWTIRMRALLTSLVSSLRLSRRQPWQGTGQRLETRARP